MITPPPFAGFAAAHIVAFDYAEIIFFFLRLIRRFISPPLSPCCRYRRRAALITFLIRCLFIYFFDCRYTPDDAMPFIMPLADFSPPFSCRFSFAAAATPSHAAFRASCRFSFDSIYTTLFDDYAYFRFYLSFIFHAALFDILPLIFRR